MAVGINNYLKKDTSEVKTRLTFREIEYLSLAALGFKNKMIAQKLYVTKSTVKKTLEIIYRKLNAKDRANAVAIAFIHNILTVKILTQMSEI